MARDDFPLLDVADALTAADEALQDAAWHLTQIWETCEQQYPPAAHETLLNLTALRELLAQVVPPGLHEAIQREQAAMQEAADRWESSS
jgi:hypothetical protein